MSTLPQRPDQRFTRTTPLPPNTAPPGLLGIKSVAALRDNPAGSPYTLLTLPAAGRLWNSSLSFAVATGNNFAPGGQNLYSQVLTGSGITLNVTELAVSDVSQVAQQQSDQQLGGISLLAGDTLILDVNNATILTHAVMRASCFVIYSIP